MRLRLGSLMLACYLGACATTPGTVSSTPTAVETTDAKPGMVSKKVCERVDNEETTGSRVGDAPKICKIVQVPADAPDQSD